MEVTKDVRGVRAPGAGVQVVVSPANCCCKPVSGPLQEQCALSYLFSPTVYHSSNYLSLLSRCLKIRSIDNY